MWVSFGTNETNGLSPYSSVLYIFSGSSFLKGSELIKGV